MGWFKGYAAEATVMRKLIRSHLPTAHTLLESAFDVLDKHIADGSEIRKTSRLTLGVKSNPIPFRILEVREVSQHL